MGHASFIAKLGGAADLAAALKLPRVRVERWVSRDRIPAQYWPDVVAVAEGRGAVGVTLDALLSANRPRKLPERTPTPAEAA